MTQTNLQSRIVNIITRQPLDEPYYNVAFEAGNYGLYQPSIDFSGPLTDDDTLLYRLIASYRDADNFTDFANSRFVTIAPTFTLNLGEQTNLSFYYEYIRSENDPYASGTVVLNDNTFRLPRSRFVGYPNLSFYNQTVQRIGYTLNHELNDNWQLRNSLAIIAASTEDGYSYFSTLSDDGILQGSFADQREYTIDNYFGQIDLLGRFNTGSIAHQLLIGFDIDRNVENYINRTSEGPGDFDLFDPDYDIPGYEFTPTSRFEYYNPIQAYGIYIQNQINLLDNLKLLIGGRYDWISQQTEILNDEIDQLIQSDGAFSPRVGLVYQPSDTVALYASYSRSFLPISGFNPDDTAFEPTRGTQYEVGIRADFLEGRLSANLAAYEITKSNVSTPDPDPVRAERGFSVQVGEQRSRGIELDIGGEILPGWNVIVSYAYTDAITTEDNAIEVGNRLANVPANQASLWTTYEIQQGTLQGLGFGLGLFYVGERQGDLGNTFQLSDYLRTDAAIYYRRGRLNAAINIRNLFDVIHYEYAFSRQGVEVGDPFTIIGSVSWEF